MAKSRRAHTRPDQDTNLVGLLTPELPPIKSHRQDARDPREAMKEGALADSAPIAIPPRISEKGEAKRINQETESKRLSMKYALNLTAAKGDIALALATTFEIPIEQAEKNMLELHDRIVGVLRQSANMSDLFEQFDLSPQMRLARLRQELFNNNPAVALKAIDMINDMDATTKSKRIGDTWEVYAQRVRNKAALKEAREKAEKPKNAAS